ncbi:SAM-dependent methyltransferase [Streptomyces sp. NPDC058953]|uniref:SAM-dependent methyltransferase n=1 Tax=unclassified Streptomyces TaxID=2593676 RepID=UPI003693CA83
MTAAFQPVSSARFHLAALGDAPEARDGYPGDEALVAKLTASGVPVREMARADRAFQIRAVTHLAGTTGIAQFVEIGPGLPPRSTPATHDIAFRYHRRRARVLYVDRDPEVVAHLNTATYYGDVWECARTVLGDLGRPDEILTEAAVHLDLDRPVALVMTGIVDQVADNEQPHAAVQRLLGALAPGSALVLSHLAHEHDPELIHRTARLLGDAGIPSIPRSFEEIAAFFTGLTAIGPGLVPVSQWEPDGTDDGAPHTTHTYGGVGHL